MSKTPITMVLSLSIVFAPFLAASAQQMIGVSGSDGNVFLLKRFVLPASTTIFGVEFKSANVQGFFPEIALLRGPITTFGTASRIASRSDVQEATGGVTTCTWNPPVSTGKVGGEYYVALRLPARSGVDPLVDMEPVAVPNGSFLASANEDALTAIGAELSFTLLTDAAATASAGKASSSGERAQTPQRSQKPTTFFANTGPNPARSILSVEFGVGESGPVRLDIYSVAGRKVKTLIHARMNAGVYNQSWDGLEDRGVRAAAGIYLAKLRVGAKVLTKKLVLTR